MVRYRCTLRLSMLGHVDAIKGALLRANADPLLAYLSPPGVPLLPLDVVTAKNGHVEVARELIQEHGIEGCGGATGGLNALCQAATEQHVEVMAGVVDTGAALIAAAHHGRKASVKFLLQQLGWSTTVKVLPI